MCWQDQEQLKKRYNYGFGSAANGTSWKISRKKVIFIFSRELFGKQRVKYSKMIFLSASLKKNYWNLGIIIFLSFLIAFLIMAKLYMVVSKLNLTSWLDDCINNMLTVLTIC